MELTDVQVGVLEDVFDVIRDRLHHYPDGELGWDTEQVQAFHDLDAKHRAEAKKRKFWWAR
jgi:hypothetical protein